MQTTFERQWNWSYDHLVEYHNKFKSLDVKRNYISPDGFKLGAWVHRQRILYKKGTIKNERYQKLLGIGFIFNKKNKTEESSNHAWEVGFSHLIDYKKEFGSLCVPTGYTSPDSYNLSTWVKQQIESFRKHKLTDIHLSKLASIGFDFEYLKSRSSKWEKGYSHLLAYYKEYGHVQVGRNYVSLDGYRLGNWARWQSYSYSRNKLSPDHYKKLLEIGFFFKSVSSKSDTDAKWETGFSHLTAYYKEHGHSRVKRNYICQDGYALGRWVHLQRIASKKGSLSAKQLEKLLSLKCSLYINNNTVYDTQWDNSFNLLIDYYNTHGDTSVRKNYKSSNGYSLGCWVNLQRIKYRNNLLSQEQIEKLQSVEFCFQPKRPHTWDLGFVKLQDYVNNHGNALVRSNYITKDGYNLGHWCVEQRKRYSILSLEKIKMLESVGFVFWKARNRKQKK